MIKLHNYVYVIINLINNKLYIGDHSTNNLNDNYLGSGQLINKAKKKYGKENFIRLDLEYFKTKKEAFDNQEKYIRLLNTLEPNGYNISPKGGHNVMSCFSENTLLKLSNAIKGTKKSQQTKTKISNKLKGKYLGVKNSQYNTIWIYKNNENKKIKKSEFEYWKNIGWTKGRITHDYIKNKLKISLKGKNKNRKHSLESRKNMSIAHIGKPSGRKGKKLSQETKIKMSKSHKK